MGGQGLMEVDMVASSISLRFLIFKIRSRYLKADVLLCRVSYDTTDKGLIGLIIILIMIQIVSTSLFM